MVGVELSRLAKIDARFFRRPMPLDGEGMSLDRRFTRRPLAADARETSPDYGEQSDTMERVRSSSGKVHGQASFDLTQPSSRGPVYPLTLR